MALAVLGLLKWEGGGTGGRFQVGAGSGHTNYC